MFGNRLPWTLLTSLTIIVNACGFNEETTAETAMVPERTYLTEPIPPCVPTVSEPDPCPVDLPTPQNVGVASIGAPSEIPTFTDRLIYDPLEDGVISVHIVIRGTVQTDTTRCEIYRFKLPNDMAEYFQRVGGLPLEGQYIVGRYHYTCFADVVIKEYLVGEGPPTIPVIMEFQVLTEGDFDDQGNIKEKYLDFYGDPQAEALTYEGREIIFFLGPPPSISVEAWVALGGDNMWFLQQTDQGIRAVAQDIWRVHREEIRNKLDLPLDEMIADVKQAAINRDTITDGRIGIDPDLPMLITDAHNLRDYYTSVGAVYDDTENATVLPPPVPGEDDSSAPTLQSRY